MHLKTCFCLPSICYAYKTCHLPADLQMDCLITTKISQHDLLTKDSQKKHLSWKKKQRGRYGKSVDWEVKKKYG